MRKEKGGKRERKRMEDKEKEGEVEERVEVPELQKISHCYHRVAEGRDTATNHSTGI